MYLPKLVTVLAPGEGCNFSRYSYWIVDAFEALYYEVDPQGRRAPRIYEVCDDAREADTIVSVHNSLADTATLRRYAMVQEDLLGLIEVRGSREDYALVG